MIPGIIRGVIASSWLRPSEELRAPNSLTTGQEIPFVEFRLTEFPRVETYAIMSAMNVVSQKAGPLRASAFLTLVSQKSGAIRASISCIAIVKKV